MFDAVFDAVFDAGFDAGFDAMFDAGFDARVDVGTACIGGSISRHQSMELTEYEFTRGLVAGSVTILPKQDFVFEFGNDDVVGRGGIGVDGCA